MLTQAQLHELLNYNPDTGVFTWKKRTSNRAPIGSVAGTLSNGYWGITIAGMRTYAHRLAFLYMEGDYPLAQVVDHIDGDKLNNKWTNLRRFSRNLNNSEVGIIERLDRWRETFGKPMGNGRNNPDNDMIYLLTDAAECIRGLRQYARHLETRREP